MTDAVDPSDLNQFWPQPAAPRPIVIFGAGSSVSDAHLPAYRKAGFPVAGLYDPDQDKAKRLAGEWGIESYASLGDAAAQNPEAAAFLDAVGRAPGSQAGGDTFGKWRDQLDGLVGAGLATIESSPAMTIYSGQQASLQIGSQGPNSVSELGLTVTPNAGTGGPITLDLAVKSERADGKVELLLSLIPN